MDAYRNTAHAIVVLGLLASTVAATPAAAEEETSHAIQGEVRDESGAPIAGAVVSLGHVPTLFEREEFNLATTGEEGRFSVPVAYPGNANIACWHPDYISTSERASTDNESILTLRRGETLEGAVEWGEALRGRAVVSAYFPDTGYQAYARADNGGSFRFGNLPNGPCEIEVRAEDAARTTRVAARTDANILSGRTNNVEIPRLDAGATLSGAVEDATGFPVVARLSLHVETATTSYVETTRCDASGQFRFAAAPSGQGHLTIGATGKASQLLEVHLDDSAPEKLAIVLEDGQPLRCSFLNAPETTRAIQAIVFFGKQERPTASLAELRTLLDQPAAWAGTIRRDSAQIDVLSPGQYTLFAYPVEVSAPNHTVFEAAEHLRMAPIHMDSLTIREDGGGVTIAAAFPDDPRPAYAAAQQPMHPIIGTWAYEHEGSTWTRTFTPQGRCILMEGPLKAWEHPYIILGEQRVCVMVEGSRRIHAIQPDGKLDIIGRFVATKVR